MTRTTTAICNLCEAECGILVEHDETRVLSIRGNDRDPLSRGHICPKGAALGELHHDPDRLRYPIKRVGPDEWQQVSWAEAFEEIADRIIDIQERHGRDAVAMYAGNPNVHSHGTVLYTTLLRKALGSRQLYNSNSMDALPRLLTSYLMYGSQALLPVPDIDRTDFWLIMGANPIVSGGSVMTAPGVKRRMKAIQSRGGKVVVIDPRRTETAALADQHVFIKPGGDAFLLAAMLHTIFAHDKQMPRRLGTISTGLDTLRRLVEPFAPERVAGITGIPAETITELALTFSDARSAVCYGRMGTCTQAYGTMASWLIDCLNIVTGNFDRPGGAMFPTPPVDLPGLATVLGQTGSFATYRGRLNNLPEFADELPVAGLMDEMEDSGSGGIRALITMAGNPVLSMAQGERMDRALAGLDFMVAIDIYRNETTRHADFILPTTTVLERDHYPLVFSALSVRNNARYARAVVSPAGDLRHDWQIITELSNRLWARRSPFARAAAALATPLLRMGPERALDLAMRTGPYKLRLADVLREPHGIDLGPLVPRLPKVLGTDDKRIALTPEPLVADVARLCAALDRTDGPEVAASRSDADSDLQLISRRELRGNNTWMHNSPKLVSGKNRCILHMHPSDADARGITDGDRVTIRSQIGAVDAPVALTDDMMPGVVSIPFGWGHNRTGTSLSVATENAGLNVNDLTDIDNIDPLSGCSSFALPVTVERVSQTSA